MYSVADQKRHSQYYRSNHLGIYQVWVAHPQCIADDQSFHLSLN